RLHFRSIVELFYGTWIQESVGRGGRIAGPCIKSTEVGINGFSAFTPAFWFCFLMHIGMAQYHDFSIVGGLWVIGHSTVEFGFEILDFFITLHQWGDHDVATVGDREIMGVWITCCNPHWWPRLLHRLWHGGRGGEIPVFPVVCVVAFPQPLYRWHQFPQIGTAVCCRKARCQPVEFELVRTACQTDFHTSIRDHIE